MDKKKGLLARLTGDVWRIFLNGLLAILPLSITIGLFSISFRLILDWLQPVRLFLAGRYPSLINAIPYVEILFIVAIIFAIGSLLRTFLIRSMVHALEALLVRIPLVRPVYTGVRQLVRAFSLQDKLTFKKVVIIEFPRPGIYSIGFLTSQLPTQVAPQEGRSFFNVFVPTTPNPTSGYFVIVPEQDLVVADLTRQEAMAMIISGGIIQPDRFAGAE